RRVVVGRNGRCWPLPVVMPSLWLPAPVALALLLLTGGANQAAAKGTISPRGCRGSTIALTLGPDTFPPRGPNGTIAKWDAEVSNLPSAQFTNPCDVVNAEIVYCCPDPATGVEVGGMSN